MEEQPVALDLEGVEAKDDAPGIHVRAVIHNGVRYAYVDYEPGAGRDEWCEEPHQGLALRGEIRYELRDGELRARAGEAFVLPAGSAHRGSNPGAETARLFLIDRDF